MTQQINLLDRDLHTGRDWCSGRLVLAAAALSVLAVGSHAAWEQWQWHRILASSSGPEAAEASSTEESIDPLTGEPIADPLSLAVQQAEARLAATERAQQALGKLVDAPQQTASRLQALIAALPESAWLTEVEFAGSRGMRISGRSLHSDDLARYAARLGNDPAFAGLPLRSLQLAEEAWSREPGPSAAEADSAAARDTEVAAKPPLLYRFELSSLDPQPASQP